MGLGTPGSKTPENTSFMAPKVYHKNRAPADAVLVDRSTKWGNPFLIGTHGTRKDVIEQYRQWVMSQPKLLEAAKEELKGKNLCCWCAPKPCHGDVLLALANSKRSLFN